MAPILLVVLSGEYWLRGGLTDDSEGVLEGTVDWGVYIG